MTRVYLSLGSNMGDRQGYLQKAVKALNDLPETEVKAVSSCYETAAWGLTDQADFLNLALALETKLPVETLLRSCQQIEKDLDRVRHEHWGPRTVDIDILLYGQEIWETEHLKVPHPSGVRGFCLVPLIEIADDLLFKLVKPTAI
ncbi:MAG: 2-amino-4-hydroxy-6-hydroxymethyldihydropteridine diphosphokinase [Streptococcus sp.]